MSKLILQFILLIQLLCIGNAISEELQSKSIDLLKEKNSISKAEIKLRNRAVIEKHSKLGEVIRLEESAFAEITAPKWLNANEGTISLWVKPMWNKKSNESHTFLTMKWSGNDNSYMALSQGWWEPGGVNRLYFILSNQDHISCSKPYNFRSNNWSMVTATWSTENEGYCRLYVDDVRIISTTIKKKSFKRRPGSNIYIGSDIASSERRSRKPNFYIASIKIDSQSYNHKRIINKFKKSLENNPILGENKLPWTSLYLKNNDVYFMKDIPGRIGEPKVIFDESSNWAISQNSTNEILSKIKKAGFNVYIPCVWHGRGTYYHSNIAHIDERISDKISKRIKTGDDPLDYLIKKAHLLGIEVHPWFTIAKREDTRYPLFYDEGTPSGAYNVHIPEFRNFIVNLVLDVVSRYSIDGINLDYIRTMGICSSVFCKEDYDERYQYSLVVDRKLATGKYNVQKTHELLAYIRVQDWQDQAIADIVKKISEGTRAIRPDLIISVDAHPIANGNRRLDGRHSIRWANMEWIDVIFNMEYSKYVDIKNNIEVRKLLKNPNKLILLLGNYEKVEGKTISRDPLLMKQYIDFVRSNWPNTGVAFYLRSMLSDEQINMLSQNLSTKEEKTNWLYQRQN